MSGLPNPGDTLVLFLVYVLGKSFLILKDELHAVYQTPSAICKLVANVILTFTEIAIVFSFVTNF